MPMVLSFQPSLLCYHFRLLGKSIPPTELSKYAADGRFEFESAKSAEYKPCEVGVKFGPMYVTP